MLRLRAIRFGGLAGTIMLAIAGILGGAFTDLPGYSTPLTVVEGPNGGWITTLWVLGTVAVVAAWWIGLRESVSVRWAAVTAALWALPMMFTRPYASRDVYAYACQGTLFNAGRNPYHEGVAALPCQWLGSVSLIWRNTPTPYGSVWISLEGLAVHLGDTLIGTITVFRVIAVLGLCMAGVFLPILARAVGMPAGRAIWIALACPLVPLFLVGGAHSDALLLGFLIAGFAVIARRPDRWPALVLGGVLLGLAISLKITIIVALPFAAVLATGGGWHFGTLVRKSVAVVGAAAAVVVGSSLISGLGFGWITALSKAGDSVQWTSPPTAVGLTITYLSKAVGLNLHGVAIVRTVSVVVLAAVLVALWWRFKASGPREGDVLYGAALAMTATVLFAPIAQPWYLTWPIALCAVVPLRRTRWLMALAVLGTILLMPSGLSLAKFTNPLMSPIVTVVCGYALWQIFRTRIRPPASDSRPTEWETESV